MLAINFIVSTFYDIELYISSVYIIIQRAVVVTSVKDKKCWIMKITRIQNSDMFNQFSADVMLCFHKRS